MTLDNILKININSKLEEKIDFKEYNDVNLYSFRTRDYCPYCKNENTFNHTNIWINIHIDKSSPFFTYRDLYDKVSKYFENNNKDLCLFYSAKCSLKENHVIYYAFTINKKGEIFKFGEYPFELIKGKIPNPNEKILKELKLNNFYLKSLISSENNLHIGSFVYIRRVLEGLIDKIPLDKEKKVSNNKMLGVKIELIKKYLSDFVRQNIKKCSSFLGNTIHNLSEKEASKNYEFILATINAFIHEINATIIRQKDKKLITSKWQEKIKKLKKQ